MSEEILCVPAGFVQFENLLKVVNFVKICVHFDDHLLKTCLVDVFYIKVMSLIIDSFCFRYVCVGICTVELKTTHSTPKLLVLNLRLLMRHF